MLIILTQILLIKVLTQILTSPFGCNEYKKY